MNRIWIAISCAGLTGAAALAGPLDKAVVPRGAQWVFHLDAEAGWASTMGRYIVDHRADLDLEELDRVKQETGIDPVKDIKGVTVYGTGPAECDGVAVIYASAAVDQMVARMLETKEDGIRQTDVEGYKVLTWTEDEKPRYAQVRPDGEGRLVIAASDAAHLLLGIHVLEGKERSLKGEQSGLGAAAPGPGSIVFASASHLPDAEALPFQHAEGLTLDAGETAHEIYADLRVTAKSTEEATNMSQVAMGAIAMARMLANNNPEYKDAVQLLNGVSVVCEQREVVGKFRISSDQVGAALAAMSEKGRPHHKPLKKKGTKKDDAGDKD